jgi:hypothetical protein
VADAAGLDAVVGVTGVDASAGARRLAARWAAVVGAAAVQRRGKDARVSATGKERVPPVRWTAARRRAAPGDGE